MKQSKLVISIIFLGPREWSQTAELILDDTKTRERYVKQVFKYEHGSVTSALSGNYDRQTDRPTNRTDMRVQREVALSIRQRQSLLIVIRTLFYHKVCKI